jgi:predicted small secreted protein
MMKRKVSVIWVVVLALIAIAACAFADLKVPNPF